jgi:transposase, IS5 family
MLTDRHAPQDLFTQIPGLCLRFEPVLAHLDRLLDDDVLFQQLKADLARRHPHTRERGRPSTPVEVILRMLVVMRLYGWSYEQTEYFVNDSLVLRQFCRVYLARVPDDTVLIRWAHCLTAATLAALHERVVQLARQAQVTRGRKLRLDTTVVATNIHPPADSSLLTDGVRGLGRLLRRARQVLGAACTLGKAVFRDRLRSMRARCSQLRRLFRSKKLDQEAKRTALQQVYQELLGIAQQSQAQGRQVQAALQAAAATPAGAGDPAGTPAQWLGERLTRWLERCAQVSAQARRRVLQGEQVPASEKVVSFFEPHTQIFQRGKAGGKVEFGRKLWLDEVEGGIVSGYAVLPATGHEAALVPAHVEQHQERCGKVPHLLTGDRGMYHPDTVQAAEQAGVKRVVLPAVGQPPPAQAAREKQRWFRAGYRWRAGLEGRISVLQRRFGLDRCRYRGEIGMERWVGWGVITHNLWQIARTQAARQAA